MSDPLVVEMRLQASLGRAAMWRVVLPIFVLVGSLLAALSMLGGVASVLALAHRL